MSVPNRNVAAGYKTTGLEEEEEDNHHHCDATADTTSHSSMYSFCPVAGVVCNICHVCVNPTSCDRSHLKRLYMHETRNRPYNHTTPNDLAYRNKVIQDFRATMEKIAHQMISAPTLDDARKVIIQYLEIDSWLYCSECKQFPCKEGINHPGSKVYLAYKPRIELDKTKRIIVPYNFQLNENTLCVVLWDILMKRNFAARLQFWNGEMLPNQSSNDEPSGVKMNDTESIVRDQNDQNVSEEASEALPDTVSSRHHNWGTLQDAKATIPIDTNDIKVEFPNDESTRQPNVEAMQNQNSAIIQNHMNELAQKVQIAELTIQQTTAATLDQHTVFHNRITELEQIMSNMEMVLNQYFREEAITSSTTTANNIGTRPPTMEGNKDGTTETNLTRRSARKRHITDNILISSSHQLTNDTDRRLRDMELQLQHVTRERDQVKRCTYQRLKEMNSHLRQATLERDQLMRERDEAVSRTEELERELSRVMQPQQPQRQVTVAGGTTLLVTNRHSERRPLVADNGGTVPDANKKRKTNH